MDANNSKLIILTITVSNTKPSILNTSLTTNKTLNFQPLRFTLPDFFSSVCFLLKNIALKKLFLTDIKILEESPIKLEKIKKK